MRGLVISDPYQTLIRDVDSVAEHVGRALLALGAWWQYDMSDGAQARLEPDHGIGNI
jgi:hypothetical protein